VSPSDGTIVFTAHGLPPIPADRVYQLWAVVGNAAISGGIFTADASGRGQLVTELAPMDGVPAAIAVTLEPAGGVPQPTGPKYLLGTPGN
jgi:anti-sigma-K factor RskA